MLGRPSVKSIICRQPWRGPSIKKGWNYSRHPQVCHACRHRTSTVFPGLRHVADDWSLQHLPSTRSDLRLNQYVVSN